MRKKLNQLLNSDLAAIFLFLYGLITQITAFPIIYGYGVAFREMRSLDSIVVTLISIWFCIPIISVFSILLATIQIKKRKMRNEKYHVSLIGLILNIMWLLGYSVFIYVVFFVMKAF